MRHFAQSKFYFILLSEKERNRASTGGFASKQYNKRKRKKRSIKENIILEGKKTARDV